MDTQVLKNNLYKNYGYSVRRYFVDKFLFENIQIFPDSSKIIDIGGYQNKQRGFFSINKYNIDVKTANIDNNTNPDILCDATNIPVADNTFDGAVITEVLEHVSNPEKMLEEARRIIKPGGQVLITVPFLYPQHADPYDYGRYTESYWRQLADRLKFEIAKLEYQGNIYAVIADLIKILAREQINTKLSNRYKHFIKSRSAILLAFCLVGILMFLNNRTKLAKNKFYQGATTGFGMILIK